MILDFIWSLAENNLFVISLAVFIGILFGRIDFLTLIGKLVKRKEMKGFSFGLSGALFVGLVLGHIGVDVPGVYFEISLALFVAAVGLMASKDIGGIVKAHGVKFIIAGFLMATVAATLTFLGARGFAGAGVVDPRYIEGVFTGALTSSPGLGAQVEGVAEEVEESIGIGYSIAYPFGVIMIIVLEEAWPKLRNIDMEEERKKFKESIKEVKTSTKERITKDSVTFSVGGFVLAVVIGGILGEIPIPLGPFGTATLGITGGILPAALLLGYVGKIGPIKTRMSHDVLSGIRSLTLAFFLAVVGIRSGGDFAGAVVEAGPILIVITFIVGLGTMAAGMFILRGIWKLDWIVTSGALTGGMTSTPGLGAAIRATKTEDVGAGYGSTYPFALLGMVIFARILRLIL